jgi:hypothetical protein
MSDLYGGSYEETAVERPSPADVSYEADDRQARATDNRAGEEPGELLTRDEYAAHMDHDNAVNDALDGHIEEADLASVDAYDEADGQTYEPLGRDEYTELTHRDTADEEGVPEHIGAADLAVIDAYDMAHDPPASPAQDEDPGEAPGGTLTEHADDDADPPRTEDASGPDADHAETPEADAGRISALEAENADLKQQLADLRAGNDVRMGRFEQQLADLERQSGSPQSGLERQEHTSQAEQSTDLFDREHDSAQRDDSKADAEKVQRRRLPSDEALTLGAAAAGGVITTVSDYAPFLHADVAGVTASVVAVGAAGLTWMRARREAKHAHQSKD